MMNPFEFNTVSASHNLNAFRSETYRSLPTLFLSLFVFWFCLVILWTVNTWKQRHWQNSYLQWALTSIPLLKSIILGLSFFFWLLCLRNQTCSFWVAFGVFVTKIFFETATYVNFLLISNGFCITQEQLSPSQRRSIACFSSLLYLSLTGYKASLPYFSVVIFLVYFWLFCVIFSKISQNLQCLSNQMHELEREQINSMQLALREKISMLRKFQGAMVYIAFIEIMIGFNIFSSNKNFLFQLLWKEFAQSSIFFYIGWVFRSRKLTPYFWVLPPQTRNLPPIHRIEMDEKSFKSMNFKEWNIGVPLDPATRNQNSVFIIVKNPATKKSPSFASPSSLSSPSSSSSSSPSSPLPSSSSSSSPSNTAAVGKPDAFSEPKSQTKPETASVSDAITATHFAKHVLKKDMRFFEDMEEGAAGLSSNDRKSSNDNFINHKHNKNKDNCIIISYGACCSGNEEIIGNDV